MGTSKSGFTNQEGYMKKTIAVAKYTVKRYYNGARMIYINDVLVAYVG